MFTGIDINATRKFTSKFDPDKNSPTVFHIGVLDPVLRAEIDDETSTYQMSSKNPDDDAKIQLSWNKSMILAIKFGLKGLDNFLDPRDKKPVELKLDTVKYAGKMREAVPDRIIAMFPSELRRELAQAIQDESRLLEDERKN